MNISVRVIIQRIIEYSSVKMKIIFRLMEAEYFYSRMNAFEKGAPVVLVSGCHIGDCHYINANHWTERRIKRIWKKMERLGLRTERLGLEWISAAEGLRFQQVMERMEQIRKTVASEEINETVRLLKKEGR